jgi:hypothetical protein
MVILQQGLNNMNSNLKQQKNKTTTESKLVAKYKLCIPSKYLKFVAPFPILNGSFSSLLGQ